jgi:hypothetical protein
MATANSSIALASNTISSKIVHKESGNGIADLLMALTIWMMGPFHAQLDLNRTRSDIEITRVARRWRYFKLVSASDHVGSQILRGRHP